MDEVLSETQVLNGQKCLYDLEFSPLGPFAPMVTENDANRDPSAPMAMDLMVPMVHPMAIGANDDHH